MSVTRPVLRVELAKIQVDLDGVIVRESVGSSALGYYDPFLILKETEAEFPAGYPTHPHRGFEAVSYILSGSLKTDDSMGNCSTLRAGDIQWLTTGRGVTHREIPQPHVHGLVLWVNLSAQHKMIPPRIQEFHAAQIPVEESNGVRVALIAGTSVTSQSPIHTLTPTIYSDFSVDPGAADVRSTPLTHNCLAYVLSGTITFGDWDKTVPVAPHHTVLFGPGDCVTFKNPGKEVARFVLISGEPLNEPCSHSGPFVMNSKEEIDKTFRDYKQGINGFENLRRRLNNLLDPNSSC